MVCPSAGPVVTTERGTSHTGKSSGYAMTRVAKTSQIFMQVNLRLGCQMLTDRLAQRPCGRARTRSRNACVRGSTSVESRDTTVMGMALRNTTSAAGGSQKLFHSADPSTGAHRPPRCCVLTFPLTSTLPPIQYSRSTVSSSSALSARFAIAAARLVSGPVNSSTSLWPSRRHSAAASSSTASAACSRSAAGASFSSVSTSPSSPPRSNSHLTISERGSDRRLQTLGKGLGPSMRPTPMRVAIKRGWPSALLASKISSVETAAGSRKQSAGVIVTPRTSGTRSTGKHDSSVSDTKSSLLPSWSKKSLRDGVAEAIAKKNETRGIDNQKNSLVFILRKRCLDSRDFEDGKKNGKT